MAEAGRRGAHAIDESEEEKHGLGRKLLGLFVETDRPETHEHPASEPSPRSAADEVAAIARATRPTAPSAPVPAAPASATPPPTAPGPAPVAAAAGRPAPPPSYKTPDFNGIFKTGGLSDDERDKLSKVEELLRNLPGETPASLKRQIVEGTLRTFGIQPEKLTAAATKAAATLDTYLGISDDDLKSRVENTRKRLAELQAEQQKLQAAIAEREQLQATMTFDVRARQAELREVVAFFGQAPAPH